MEKKENNQVHLNGYIKSIKETAFEDKVFLNVIVGTSETIPEKDPKYTSHMVKITADSDLAEKLRNLKEGKNFISLDGRLMANEKDGKRFFYVSALPDSVKLNEGMQKGESRNTVTIEGNIASLDIYKDKEFATMSVAMNYYIPGEGEEKYKQVANFLPVRISGKRLPETFKQLVDGSLAVGDKISVRGQMHNDDYVKEDETKVYAIKIDANKVELVAKKKAAQAEAPKEEAKEAKKAEKKAEPKKKSKGMKM